MLTCMELDVSCVVQVCAGAPACEAQRNKSETQQQAGQPAHSYLQPVSASLRYSASVRGARILASCEDAVPILMQRLMEKKQP